MRTKNLQMEVLAQRELRREQTQGPDVSCLTSAPEKPPVASQSSSSSLGPDSGWAPEDEVGSGVPGNSLSQRKLRYQCSASSPSHTAADKKTGLSGAWLA